MPAVSVIIPTYNTARFLVQAIDSVLAQSLRDFEIIVVDDGSTDDTRSILRRYGDAIRTVHQANLGVSAARNAGIAASRGRLVAFLDADDVWSPVKLDRQFSGLAASPGYRACYTALEVVDSDLRTVGVNWSIRRGSTLEDLLLSGNVVGTPSSVICDRELLAGGGGFDPALSYSADWDLWVRLSAHTEFLYLHEPLVKYRQHEGAMSQDASLIERDNLRLLEKSFGMSNLPASIRRRRRQAFGRNYRVLSGIYLKARRPAQAIRCAARAIVMDPRQAGYIAGFPLRRLRNAG
jgi:glycosyltransferase involved in cell wall biosynthesis